MPTPRLLLSGMLPRAGPSTELSGRGVYVCACVSCVYKLKAIAHAVADSELQYNWIRSNFFPLFDPHQICEISLSPNSKTKIPREASHERTKAHTGGAHMDVYADRALNIKVDLGTRGR